MSLMDSLNSMLGAGSKNTCPDCQSSMKGGQCDECGYGQEDDSGQDTQHELMEMQNFLDLKDALQTAMKIVDRIILSQTNEMD